ncbi:MAG: hypothetical protein K5981_06705 [Clostridia bacterium]|nr:hypothetical protein [Clostridia bacterium]
MRVLGRIWKIILALILLAGAAFVFLRIYLPNQVSYEVQRASLVAQNQVLQQQVIENAKYSSVDIEQLEKEEDKMEGSRLDLYRKFPQEFRQEDQIIYVVWLEEMFGTEIQFEFGSAEPIAYMSDGSVLGGVQLTVNFDATYEAYKKMIETLSTDERVASVSSSAFNTYKAQDGTTHATGVLTLVHYLIVSPQLEYYSPSLVAPPVGKDDLWD